MSELTLESLAARIEALEKQLAEQKTEDGRRVTRSTESEEFARVLETEIQAASDAEWIAAQFGNEVPEGEIDLLGDDPESIKRWLRVFDAIPPLEMSEDREAAWKADRDRRKMLDAIAIDSVVNHIAGSGK